MAPDVKRFLQSSVPVEDKRQVQLAESGAPVTALQRFLAQLDEEGTLAVPLDVLGKNQLDAQLTRVLSPLIAAWKIPESRDEIRAKLRGIVVLDTSEAARHPQYAADRAAVDKINRILQAANVMGFTDRIRSGVQRQVQAATKGVMTADMAALLDTSYGNFVFDITSVMEEINILTTQQLDQSIRDKEIKAKITGVIQRIIEEWSKSNHKSTIHLHVDSGCKLDATIVRNFCTYIATQLRRLPASTPTAIAPKVSILDQVPQYGPGVTPRKIVVGKSLMPTLRL